MDFDVDAASWAWDFDDAEDNADMDVNLAFRDALRTLGLNDDADPTPRAVRAAYLQRSLETHPDRAGGSAVAFRRVQAAYSYLMKSQNDEHERAKQAKQSDGDEGERREPPRRSKL